MPDKAEAGITLTVSISMKKLIKHLGPKGLPHGNTYKYPPYNHQKYHNVATLSYAKRNFGFLIIRICAFFFHGFIGLD